MKYSANIICQLCMTHLKTRKEPLERQKWIQNKLIMPTLIVCNEQITVIPMWYNKKEIMLINYFYRSSKTHFWNGSYISIYKTSNAWWCDYGTCYSSDVMFTSKSHQGSHPPHPFIPFFLGGGSGIQNLSFQALHFLLQMLRLKKIGHSSTSLL